MMYTKLQIAEAHGEEDRYGVRELKIKADIFPMVSWWDDGEQAGILEKVSDRRNKRKQKKKPVHAKHMNGLKASRKEK